MRNPRIFVDHPLRPDETLDLPADASRHLLRVLRLRPGAGLRLFNGDGHDYRAELLDGDRSRARVRLLERGDPEPPASLPIRLGLGISKGERMDFAIQKSVELGVQQITPLLTDRCVVRLSPERQQRRLAHWRGVLIAACEQSGRRRLPLLEPAAPLAHWLEAPQPGDLRLLLDHRSPAGLADLPRPRQGVELLIGPEGGLSEQERAAAGACGFEAVRLGPRVLRTETAPLAAIAAIQSLWGDFS